MNNIIDSKILEKVIQVEKNTKINRDKYKLGFHLMPPVGWLNDPNGLCQFKGIYHIFFQYSPFDADGGIKFWGHYTSKNMISWKYEGVFMAPDMPFDKDGVYSGCTLVENDQMYIYYTGNVKESGEHDYITSGRQANTILVKSDGKVVSRKKVIMTNDNYPSIYTCHIRDPKVWNEKGCYYMVLGGRENIDGTQNNDIGKVLLYSSFDLENWKFENEIKSKERFGYMWECPDIIILEEKKEEKLEAEELEKRKLKSKKFLSISPQGLQSEEFKYQNIYQSGYFTINGNLKGECSLKNFVEWDMGFDFYAPQTFVDEYDRRILIGWMGLPDIDYTNKTLEYGWQHNLTLPRELYLKKGKILQKPIDELKQLRIKNRNVKLNKNIKLTGLNELKIDADGKTIENIKISISEGLKIQYKKSKSIFSIEFENEIGAGRTIRKAKLEKLNKINMFIDKSCVEIFLNEGEKVFTTRFYPENYTLKITNCENIKVNLWDLLPMEIKY